MPPRRTTARATTDATPPNTRSNTDIFNEIKNAAELGRQPFWTGVPDIDPASVMAPFRQVTATAQAAARQLMREQYPRMGDPNQLLDFALKLNTNSSDYERVRRGISEAARVARYR